MNKKDSLIDVAVLLVFFNRPTQLSEVFEQIKKARPSRLFLYQDGARNDSPSDKIKISECRKIVNSIDWDCQVEKLYQTQNYGCDPSGYLAQKWAFSLADRCIVLEDDSVPSVSFFRFCKELLDKYENDYRISMISGLNHEEITQDIDDDYFFTSNCSIWGWASWRRVINQWDSSYKFLDNPQVKQNFEYLIKSKKYIPNFINSCQTHLATGREHYETILISNVWINNGLCIVPKCNMIHNIGLTSDATHYGSDIKCIPKPMRNLFTMKTYEINSKMNHPKYIMDHIKYKERVYKIMCWGHPLLKLYRYIRNWIQLLLRGHVPMVINDIKSRILK